MREPLPVEEVHLRWLSRTVQPWGIAIPSKLVSDLLDEGWIEWAPCPYVAPHDSPYSSVRLTVAGRAMLVVRDIGKAKSGQHLPYRHGSAYPWTLPKFRDDFAEEIAYTAAKMLEARNQ